MWQFSFKEKKKTLKKLYYKLEVDEANLIDKLTDMLRMDWLYCDVSCFVHDLDQENERETKILTGKEFTDAIENLDMLVADRGGIEAFSVGEREKTIYKRLITKIMHIKTELSYGRED